MGKCIWFVCLLGRNNRLLTNCLRYLVIVQRKTEKDVIHTWQNNENEQGMGTQIYRFSWIFFLPVQLRRLSPRLSPLLVSILPSNGRISDVAWPGHRKNTYIHIISNRSFFRGARESWRDTVDTMNIWTLQEHTHLCVCVLLQCTHDSLCCSQ